MLRIFPTTTGMLAHANHKLVASHDLGPFDVVWVLARELASDYPAGRFGPRTRVLHAGIRDFSAPTGEGDVLFRAQLDEVCEVLRRGGRVLAFCYGGCGRTAIALAAVAIRLDGFDVDKALGWAKSACGGPEEEVQRAYVRGLASG